MCANAENGHSVILPRHTLTLSILVRRQKCSTSAWTPQDDKARIRIYNDVAQPNCGGSQFQSTRMREHIEIRPVQAHQLQQTSIRIARSVKIDNGTATPRVSRRPRENPSWALLKAAKHHWSSLSHYPTSHLLWSPVHRDIRQAYFVKLIRHFVSYFVSYSYYSKPTIFHRIFLQQRRLFADLVQMGEPVQKGRTG